MEHTLNPDQLEAIRRLGTCAVSNAIETFDIKLRNEGFADAGVRCIFPSSPPILAYAVTGRVRSSTPPPVGHTYYDRTDWLDYLLTIPAPRVVVIEDIGPKAGLGAFVGEVHASIQKALGSVGAVTNGAVRDLEALETAGFQVFAGNVAVSHAFVHMVDFGCPVEVGGLQVQSGDLILGDRHGVLTVPRQIAAQIPARAQSVAHRERQVIDYCKSDRFSLQELRELIRELN